MASVSSKLESCLKCPVCQDTVRQPKTLQCFHSFCEECVTQLLTISHTDELGVKCPVCRAFTEQSQVKTNFLMTEMLEAQKGNQGGPSSMCEVCLEGTGGWKCVECKQFLCDSCKVLHLRVSICRGHHIVPADEADTAIDKLVYCKKHTDQTVVLSCRECEELLCIKCKVTTHSKHDADTIEDTLERVLPEMEGYCEKIKLLIANIDDNKEELNNKTAEVKAAFEKCRKDGEIQLQKMIDKATEDYNALVKELDIREEEEVNKLRLDRQKEYKQLVEWMETCKQSAKGVTLVEQIQSGLGRRMRQLAKLQTLEQKRDRISLPELVLSPGNFSVEENMIGRIEYRSGKMLEAQRQTDCRNTEKTFKDILQGKLKQSTQVKLKGWCNRMSLIRGDIWATLHGTKFIQVIDVEGNPQRDIRCTFKPYSVTESSCGEIIVASNTGLHVLYPDGTVQFTICSDKFFDVCFFGEEILGLNSSKRILQTYSRSGDGEWRHSGDIGASRGIGSSDDCVVTDGSEIIFIMYGESRSQYYKCEGKTGQREVFSNTQRVMSGPYICGVDSTGAVLLADWDNNRFQVHESDNQWSVVSLDPISSHRPHDFLYDADTDAVWVLSYASGGFLTKLKKIQ